MYYIYKMIHKPTGRVYIGQRKCPAGKTPETDSYHGSGKVWKCIYNAHPDECVKVVIDTYSSKGEVNQAEIDFIGHYKAVWGDFCVNVAPGGEGVGSGEDNPLFGKRRPEEVRMKISETMKCKGGPWRGKQLSEEHRMKLSESHKRKQLSEETRRKMSEAHKRKQLSEETRRKMSEAKKGKHLSDEHKRRISEAKRANLKARKENAQ